MFWKKKRQKKFTHVGPEEEHRMLTLRRQGYSTQDIASAVGRSPKAVNRILQKNDLNRRGQFGLRERPPDPSSRDPLSDDRRKGVHHSRGSVERLEERLLQALEPGLASTLSTLMEQDPDLVKEVLFKVMGLKWQRPTLDDFLVQEVEHSSDLRRRLAQNYISQMEHGGRTEMEIVEEGLTMLIKLAEMLNRNAWSGVASEFVRSGQMPQLVQILTSHQPGKVDPGQVSDRTQTTKLFKSPGTSVTGRRVVSPAILATIRKPLPRLDDLVRDTSQLGDGNEKKSGHPASDSDGVRENRADHEGGQANNGNSGP